MLRVRTVLVALGLMVGSAAFGVLPSSQRALMIAQSGDMVTLQWKSERGLYYTLMYTDAQYDESPQGRAVWQPLPGYTRMPGTGRTETATFKTDPTRPRRYNLHVETEEQVRKTQLPGAPQGK